MPLYSIYTHIHTYTIFPAVWRCKPFLQIACAALSTDWLDCAGHMALERVSARLFLFPTGPICPLARFCFPFSLHTPLLSTLAQQPVYCPPASGIHASHCFTLVPRQQHQQSVLATAHHAFQPCRLPVHSPVPAEHQLRRRWCLRLPAPQRRHRRFSAPSTHCGRPNDMHRQCLHHPCDRFSLQL